MTAMQVRAPDGRETEFDVLSVEEAIARAIEEFDLPRRTMDNRLLVWTVRQDGTVLRTGAPTPGTWSLDADGGPEAIAEIDEAMRQVGDAVSSGTAAATPHLMTKLTLLRRTGAREDELDALDEAVRRARRDDTGAQRSRQRSALALPIIAALGVLAVGVLVFISASGNVDRPDPVFEPSTIDEIPAVIDGEISLRGEIDSFEIELESGEAIEIRMNGASAFQEMDTELRVRGPGGNEVAYNDDFNGLNSRIVLSADESGVYVIEAGALGGCCIGTYRLTVDPFDAEGLESIDMDVELPFEGEGTIGLPGIYDRYRVTLAAGEAFSAQAFGGPGGFGGQFDMEMRIYDEDFFELQYNDDFNGLDPRIDWVAPVDGVYIVEVGALGGQNVGDYRIQIDSIDPEDAQEGPFFGGDDGFDGGEFGGDQFLDQSLSVTFGSYDGEIGEFGEYDEYAIDLAEGQAMRVWMEASDGSLDPLLRVLDGFGNVLAENDDFNGLDSRVDVVAGRDGTYFIRAIGLGGGSTGAYVLTIEDLDPDETAQGTAGSVGLTGRSEEVTIPYETDGEIFDFGVADEFFVELSAGDTIVVSAEALEAYQEVFDLELVIGDPADEQVAQNDDREPGVLDPQIVFTAATDGVHVIHVRALAGASTGVYLLTIEAAAG